MFSFLVTILIFWIAYKSLKILFSLTWGLVKNNVYCAACFGGTCTAALFAVRRRNADTSATWSCSWSIYAWKSVWISCFNCDS